MPIGRWPAPACAFGADDFPPDGHARDGQLFARAVVGLHQGAEREGRPDPSAGGADAALEAMGHHAGAAAHVALRYRPRACPVQRLEDVRLRDVLADAVVQERVRGLADHRLVPGDFPLQGFVEPAVHGVADDAHRVGAGDHHGATQHATFDHPRCAGHLAKTIACEPAGEHRLPHLPPGKDGGDPGADGALAGDQLARALDDGGVPHFHPRHIGDGVQRAWRAREGHTKSAGARPGLRHEAWWKRGGQGAKRDERESRRGDAAGGRRRHRDTMPPSAVTVKHRAVALSQRPAPAVDADATVRAPNRFASGHHIRRSPDQRVDRFTVTVPWS
jgi:hypothetical protein